MSLFNVDHLSYSYPGYPESLTDVSFRIDKGDKVALLGANGSGKSTLLFLLDGLYFASTGSISFEDSELTEDKLDRTPFGRSFRSQVGFLFQNSDAQLFCPTVTDELAFGPLQLELPKEQIEARVHDVLKLLRIQHMADRKPQTLSAGQKKLVALGSLLTLAPSVLLMDEPTAGLDPRSQAMLLDVLDALHEAGTTLVTATHDIALLPELSSRALVLNEDHRLAFNGKTCDALRDIPLLISANLMYRRSSSK